MKPTLALSGLVMLACAALPAQERVVVPARNTSHPRQVFVKTFNHAIIVKTYEGKDVIVETGTDRTRERRPPADTAGMKRLDTRGGLAVTEEDNVIHVNTSMTSEGPVTVTVPADTSLNLQTHNSNVDVTGVRGEIVAHTFNGHINLTNVSGTVVADTFNGPINATMDGVDGSKPLSFSTFNSKIDVTFPAGLKANVAVKTNHGDVFSDFDVNMSAGPSLQADNSGQGKYRVRFDRGLTGTINGGGVPISFHTFNGAVYIRKGK